MKKTDTSYLINAILPAAYMNIHSFLVKPTGFYSNLRRSYGRYIAEWPSSAKPDPIAIRGEVSNASHFNTWYGMM